MFPFITYAFVVVFLLPHPESFEDWLGALKIDYDTGMYFKIAHEKKYK